MEPMPSYTTDWEVLSDKLSLGTHFAMKEKNVSQDHGQNGQINQILSLCTEHRSGPWQLQPEIHLKYWSNIYN